VTYDEREKAIGLFADQMVKLAAKHPASGFLRSLIVEELRNFLGQIQAAETK
jgi:hypothetical protein